MPERKSYEMSEKRHNQSNRKATLLVRGIHLISANSESAKRGFGLFLVGMRRL